MKVFTGAAADGTLVSYVDENRWLWPLALGFALLPLLAIGLHFEFGNSIWLVMPLVATYLAAPLIDLFVGESEVSPSTPVIMSMERDPYYRRLTVLVVPLHYIATLAATAYAASQPLTFGEFLAIAILAGTIAGLAINTGHELGHKNTTIEKTLAKIALALPAYGHFSIDHNRGHHKNVATFEDHASSRMGENIYAFALREIPGSFKNAWSIEKERLQRRNRPVYGAENQILQSYALSVAITVGCTAAFGWKALPFLAIHHLLAYWQLTSANYVEHYGLLRKKNAAGKVERCKPHHSWNSNHRFTNLLLFNLQRHSDHHTYPLRRYQSLRNFDDIPRLPSGYVGMYLLAYIPPLWFRAMNPRLMALPSVNGSLDNVNLHLPAAATLRRQWAARTKTDINLV